MSEQAPEQKALDAAKAEAVGVRHADGSVTVPLITDTDRIDVRIPPPTDWFEGAVEALSAGQISQWVKLAVEDPATLKAWVGARKRYRHLDAFLSAWTGATGEDPGESAGSSDS